MASLTTSSLLRHLLFTAQQPRGLSMLCRLPSLHLPIGIPFPLQPRRLPHFLIPLATTTFANLSSFLSSLWDSILLAVPKKRSSYSKKRSRQLAGKGLKDLTNLNHCSACGRVKRMHVLCPYCVSNIKDMWAGRLKKPTNAEPLSKTGPVSKSTEMTLSKPK